MKKEDIYNALSDIRPEYLDEADNYKKSPLGKGKGFGIWNGLSL